jgi:prephenate dehydrogenase|tara:strand:- start:2377 stop:2616 length:240 start_codon:yes stop_codon:yes gene_type:complete
MIYYLLHKSDNEGDTIYEPNIIGEESFGVFYQALGFTLLNRIINQEPQMLEDISIIDERKKNYTITEFLDKLEKWKIKS